MPSSIQASESCHEMQTRTCMNDKTDPEGYLDLWLSSSFPVLCNLLDQITEDSEPSAGLNGSNNAANALKDLFGKENVTERRIQTFPEVGITVPRYKPEDKFVSTEKCQEMEVSVVPPDSLHSSKLEEQMPLAHNLVEQEFSYAEYHEHEHSCRSGLVQLCSGPKVSIFRTIDNKVREMDAIIKNPALMLGATILETCTLNLPGPYTLNRPVRNVKLESNRYTLDVLGLFILLVDTILAANAVAHVMYKGASVPLEFSQDIVKIVSAIQSGFPKIFSELQKLVMYSTVTSILRKAPFKWNKCMIYVLEDLIIHPLKPSFGNSIELEFLAMILQKRAKNLLKLFSSEKFSCIFNSTQHRTVIQRLCHQPPTEDAASFMKISAMNCLEGHRVKPIRFEVKDKLVETYLRDIFVSYKDF
ncbi:uncharacterized protein LOC108680102 [Hyalella azteca]|uniref:Uncharacterized protein LOC108680102 n=1 Tax=Hyalella azteca TaxID=294128 RepID=A0A8B7PGB4_HYAAZ|nr:uncharacterized protein LOC108680102 [Hyalella azteca]